MFQKNDPAVVLAYAVKYQKRMKVGLKLNALYAVFVLMFLTPTAVFASGAGLCATIFTENATVEPVAVFKDLLTASKELDTLSTQLHKENFAQWLPGDGQNFIGIEKMDFNKGKFYAPLEMIMARQKDIVALSHKQMVVVNGAHMVFGTFIPDSYFGQIAKNDGAFPAMAKILQDLLRQPFLEWKADGSVAFHQNGLNRFLFEKIKEQNHGRRFVVYRGQSEMDATIVDLLRAIARKQPQQAQELRERLHQQILSSGMNVKPEALQKLRDAKSPEEFAQITLQDVRRLYYLFTTPSKEWAHYFSMGGKNVHAYELKLDAVPDAMKDILQIGADGNGVPPSNIEIGLPFNTYQEALQSANLLN